MLTDCVENHGLSVQTLVVCLHSIPSTLVWGKVPSEMGVL